MFRSIGEFQQYCRQTFRAFAKERQTAAAAVAATMAIMEAEKGEPMPLRRLLNKQEFPLAFYVLFGYEPSVSLYASLFACEGVVVASPSGRLGRAVDEESFVRFVSACAAHESGLLVEEGRGDSGNFPDGSMWSPITWPMFESLAAKRSFFTLSDLVDADCANPLVAALSGGCGEAGTLQDTRRTAVLHHVFQVMDGDGDGKVQYSDFHRFLSA